MIVSNGFWKSWINRGLWSQILRNMASNIIQIHPKDNVLVALRDLPKGTKIPFDGSTVVLQNHIPAKHKFFTQDMQLGDEVIMYGTLVGKAQLFIPRGGIMNTETTKHAAEPYGVRPYNHDWDIPDISRFEG